VEQFNMATEQNELELAGNSMAGPIDEETTRRALDELFQLTHQYSSTEAYGGLLSFIARFRRYSPYNAMLVHIQMPGATYVSPPHRWLQEYGRRIRPAAHPLAILQPMGPVMFVFDVSDTEPLPDAPPLPQKVTSPFEVRGGNVGRELERTVENVKRDGVRVTHHLAGSQRAGCIAIANPGVFLEVDVRLLPQRETVKVPVRYELLLNSGQPREVQYATLVHELAHLYCGHLGTPNPKWWRDRRRMDLATREFEAESVCYLVCQRLGIDNPSEEYLSGYLRAHEQLPPISLEAVMAASGLVEKMGAQRLKLRKDGSAETPAKS
jgi:hypothetical protein